MLRISSRSFSAKSMRHKIIFLVLLIILGLILSGCRSVRTPAPTTSEKLVEIETPVLPELLVLPEEKEHSVYKELVAPTLVYQFYASRKFKPLWFDSAGKSLQADTMLKTIKQSRYQGLLASDFHLAEFKSLQDSMQTLPVLARMDVLYTDAFLLMLHQVKYGRISKHHMPDSIQINLLNELESKQALLPLLESQEPCAFQYRNLKKAMALVINETPDSVRFKLLEGESFNSMKDFALVQSIEINLERWRAMQETLGERYIVVNIPAYTLYLIEEDTIIFQSKVVVGKPESPTPNLSSQVECFVLFPYWYVPRSIAVEEYLPIIQRDPSFITRNNFDVLNSKGEELNPDSLDWASFHENYFPVSFRQHEGPDNSLGLIKFVFDNPYAVFLHDTNAKGSFKKNMRALSHGCVRVEEAFELAHYLLTGKTAKKSPTLEKYLAAGDKRTVNVPHPIPIHLTYFTCEFLEGNLYVYPDIYQLDASLIHTFYSHAVLP